MPELDGVAHAAILESHAGRNSSKNASALKRFGCLCYFEDQGPKMKINGKWGRGVHVELCPSSSGHKIRTWGRDIRGLRGYSTIELPRK